MFIKPHLDNGDILYDKTFNNFFHERLESVQYNAALVIKGAIRGSSRETLSRTSLWIITAMTMAKETFSHFQNNKRLISQVSLWINTNIRKACMTRHKSSVPLFNVKHDYFKNSFFPSTVI